MSIFRFAPRGARFGMPFWELERMRDHIESLYNTLSEGVSQLRKNYTGVFPPVNLSEDDVNLYLTAELPGAAAEALKLSVKDGTITLTGEMRAAEAGDGERAYHRREREGGSFSRTLELPAKVDADRVSAAFKNGVLTVTMPKAAEARAHSIAIQSE